MAKVSRIDLYLQTIGMKRYVNTAKENELVNKFETLYELAKSAQESTVEANPEQLKKCRKAYMGILNGLDKEGKEGKRFTRQMRKMAFEIVESLVDNSIPMAKIQPRYKTDLPLVKVTEDYLKFEADRILTKYENDRSERSTYVDGTGWYKIGWDSLDRTHERSGDAKIWFRTIDQIVPQPGVIDYHKLEYIFEREQVSLTQIYDLYGRLLTPTSDTTNVIEIVNCYYLNEDRIVGLFSWSPSTLQVVCNEKDWQIRKLRVCSNCKTVNPIQNVCAVCGGTSFRFINAENDTLDEDLMVVYNPYEVGETEDENTQMKAKVLIPAGTIVPYYKVRQLPFVPRPAISSLDSLYGISEVKIVLDMQDAINKILTKSVDKTLKSGAIMTKPEKVKIADQDETFKVVGLRTAEEGSMFQVKQVMADTSQDLILSNQLYDSAKSSSGITDSFQGKHDTTATSGKAKQYAAMQSAGRIESLRVMKNAAFAGVYELLFKYLLAFSDETRAFVKVLPDGTTTEETWSKYMFLRKDEHGDIYYRDDFHFDCDPAATLSQNRVSMWQETTDKFIQAAFGNPADPRTLEVYWNTMDSLQYPLAGVALAGIKDNSQHLPAEVEQALLQDPEAMQAAMQVIEAKGEHRGGARANSGPAGNGATHAANIERTNSRNRASNTSEAFTPQSQDVSTVGQGGNLQ